MNSKRTAGEREREREKERENKGGAEKKVVGEVEKKEFFFPPQVCRSRRQAFFCIAFSLPR